MESPTTSTRTSYSGLRHVVGPGYPARLSDASDAAHVHASDTSDAATDASAHVGVAEVDAGSSARTAGMSSASAAVEIGSTRSRSRRRRGASDALGGGVGAFSAASASSAPSAPTDDRGSAMVTGDAGDGTPLTTWRYENPSVASAVSPAGAAATTSSSSPPSIATFGEDGDASRRLKAK